MINVLPSTDSVIENNKLAIQQYGGKSTVLPPVECVDGAIKGAASSTYYICEGEELDCLVFASNVLFQIAKTRHCFADGNKRTAWMTAVDIFYKMGIGINATQKEAEDMVLEVASGSMNVDQIVEWFAGRIDDLDTV